MLVKSAIFDILKPSRAPRFSLSRYFPAGTTYFYGYPTGDESGFLNLVPPAVEELVSARPLACAGNHISVLTFANAIRPDITGLIHRELGSPLVSKQQICSFPGHIDANLIGSKRNQHVRTNLKQLVAPGSLVMAQPFLDEDIDYLYQISPKLINWLNDKKHLTSFVPEQLVPSRYATFKNGQAFANTHKTIPTPCVVKVSSSSAGDGVYICRDAKSLRQVKVKLSGNNGAVIAEQFIQAVANYGVQFGVPEDQSLPIDIIGINQQLTTDEGEFIGGIVDQTQTYPHLQALKNQLISDILPQVRELGWYGVGCFDVLLDANGQLYIIDANFRMTGMTAYLMLSANNQISKPLVSFSGQFAGSLSDLHGLLKTRPKSVHILTATESEGICRFNGAMLLEDVSDAPRNAQQLLDLGIVSKALEQLV